MSFSKSLFSIFGAWVVFVLFGCATNTFKVNSDPLQADVYVVNPKTGDRKIIGKTPVNMPNEEFRTLVGEDIASGEFYTLVIEKPGFGTQSFSLPASKFGTLVTNLDVKLKQGGVEKELRVAQEILDHLFLAQKFANMSQFERAHIEIDKVLVPFPTFTRALSMRASIYFAQKNWPESLKWYEETVKADSQAEEAVKMIGKVKDIIAGKNPSAVAKTASAADANRAPANTNTSKATAPAEVKK